MDGAVEVVGVFRGEVAEGGPLEVGPEVFDGIEGRGVGRKRDQFEPGIAGLEGFEFGSAVAGATVPDDDQAAADVPEELTEKVRDVRAFEGAVGNRVEGEAESAPRGRKGQGGDDRYLFPVSAADEELRRLAAWGEGASAERTQQQAAFIDSLVRFASKTTDLLSFVPRTPGAHPALEKMLRKSGASRRTMERLFREETSMGLGQWLRRRNLMHAVGLLAMGESVNAVALEIGYNSPSAFIVMFRRELGQTPARYFERSR